MKAQAESTQTLVLGVYAREFPGGLLKLDPALRMPSLLPHDLCHGRSSSLAPSSDRIPVELFQILKDDAMKLLHSICQQIWKTQQWPQDWKRSVFIAVPKKGNAKECSNYRTIALISHASKVMLNILQARRQQ